MVQIKARSKFYPITGKTPPTYFSESRNQSKEKILNASDTTLTAVFDQGACECDLSTLRSRTIILSRFRYKILGALKNSITNILLSIWNSELKFKCYSQDMKHLPIFILGYRRESVGNQLIHNYSSVCEGQICKGYVLQTFFGCIKYCLTNIDLLLCRGPEHFPPLWNIFQTIRHQTRCSEQNYNHPNWKIRILVDILVLQCSVVSDKTSNISYSKSETCLQLYLNTSERKNSCFSEKKKNGINQTSKANCSYNPEFGYP